MNAEEITELPPRNLSDIMDNMDATRDERRKIAARDKELVAEWDSLQAELITALDEQGMKRASNDVVTATITEEDVPQIIDWDVVWDYILSTGDVHYIQRRVATAAWREAKAAGQLVPGTEVFRQRKISLRKRS